MEKVLVALSGGVDSSAAAVLLKRAGYACVGATMRLLGDASFPLDGDNPCLSDAGIRDARAVADALGIPHIVCEMCGAFKKHVVDAFVSTYLSGRTPNPCVACNRYLKFGSLYRVAEENGCTKIATGHYARIGHDEANNRYYLRCAADRAKDQSYMLYALTPEELARTLFPLGELTKRDARAVAAEAGLGNADKKDSQDICFVPDGDYAAFIERYTKTPVPAGNFLDADGNILGTHRGHIHYTIGQRKGLGIASESPLYVVSKDARANTVTLSHGEGLYTRSLDADGLCLSAVPSIPSPMRIKAKIRYRQAEQWATVWQTGEDSIHVEFDEEQRAVSPGQAVVLYDGDVVIGGGTIR